MLEIALLIIAIIFFGLGLNKIQLRNKLIRTGIVTEGIIDSTVLNISRGNNIFYHYNVKFLTKENLWIKKKSDEGTFPSLFNSGEKVKIIYDKNDPERFIIESKKMTIFYIVFIFIGSISLLIFIIRMIL